MAVHPAIVLHRPGDAPRLEDVTVELPRRGEVLVRIVAAGVCHTDIAAVRNARAYPVVLGHEGAGIVEAVGSDVTTLSVGDHVVINWQAKCGRCRHCVSGRREYCSAVLQTRGPSLRSSGVRLSSLLNAGTFCPAVVVPVEAAVGIRRDVALDKAALLGCAVATGVGAALYGARVHAGESVVVIGVGGVGLNCVQGARLANAGRVIAIDVNAGHLTAARQLGATDCIDSSNEHAVDAVAALTDGVGVDHVMEVTGRTSLMADGLRMLSRGGTLTIVGAAERADEFAFRPREFMSNQQRIQGCIFGNVSPERDLPLFADWYVDGRLKLDELHTSTIRLQDVPNLFKEGYVTQGIRTVISMENS